MGEMEGRWWLSVVVGRRHTHWACFRNHELKDTWATELLNDGHIAVESVFGLPVKMLPDQVRELLQAKANEEDDDYEPLVYIASDDPVQSQMWAQRLPHAKMIALQDLMLKKVPRNIEIQRVLCLRGAASKWGWPVLVIDASDNITYSASDDQGEVFGGAMLPGVATMLQLMINQGIPTSTELPESLPTKWATASDDPVQSGVIHTVLAGMAGFTSDFSKRQGQQQAKVVFTGEDGFLLWQWFREQYKPLADTLESRCLHQPHLAHLGVRWKYIQDTCSQSPHGGPGYIGHTVMKRFGGKFYRGTVKEYLPPLDEEADRGEAFWGLEYQDGDVEEVDEAELRELLENAKQARTQQKEKRPRSTADKQDEHRTKRQSSREIVVVDDSDDDSL